MLAALLVLVAQETSPSLAWKGERHWPLGLRVVEVTDLPRGNWITTYPFECDTKVVGDASALEVELRGSDGRYFGAVTHFWLTPTGVQARTRQWSCTGGWFGAHVAGTACLVTNGETAVLEFEIYDGDSTKAALGRAELGARGAELAKRFRPPLDPDAVHLERVEFEYHGREYEATGSVDAVGRRQGLWTTRESGGDPVVGKSWRDGVPDGISVLWHRSGERTVHEWHQGVWTCSSDYAPDGRKLRDRVPNGFQDERREQVRQLHTHR